MPAERQDIASQPGEQAGGLGEPSDRAKRWEQRQHLRVLEAAIYGGWAVKPEDYVTIPRDLRAIASDENASPRDRMRAMEALVHIEQKRVENAIELDRIYRLEAGLATDRVSVQAEFTDDQREAVARAIMSVAPDTPIIDVMPVTQCPKPKRRKRLPKPPAA